MKSYRGGLSPFHRSALALAVIASLYASSAQAACLPPPEGLISWWRAEGTATDHVGANHGVLQGGVSYQPGQVGQAFALDGSSGFVRIPASASLDVGGGPGLTIECWIRPSALADPRPVIEWNNGTSMGVQLWISEPWVAGLGGPGDVFANITDDSGGVRALVSAPGLLTTSRFHHVAVTYDKGNGMGYLYCDGQVVFSAQLGVFRPQTTYDLYVGRRPSPELASYFPGLIDEVSVYARALSTNEIQALFQAGNEGKCSGPSAPFISGQPAAETEVLAGDNVSLAIDARGTQPIGFQWSKDNVALDNQTNAALVLSNIQLNQAGVYSALVTNQIGSIQSSNAIVRVYQSWPCGPFPSQIAAWWPAENNPGDDVNHLPVQAFGALSYQPGKVGVAFDFAGGHIRVADNPALRFTNAMTVEGWVYMKSRVDNADFVAKWDATSGPRQSSYVFGIDSTDKPYFTVSRDGTTADARGVSSINAVPLNTWTHFAATYDGKTLSIYLNGILENSSAFVSTGSIFQGTNDLGIAGAVGGVPAGTAANLFPGRLDELSLYARALNDTEIKDIYRSRSTGKCGPPVVPYLLTQPAPLTEALVGETVSFKVDAGGTQPLGYQWVKDTVALDNETNAALVLPNVQLNHSGTYSVVITNGAGTAQSSNAVLRVYESWPCSPAVPGIASWWRGENDLNDETGGNPGTINGNVTFTAGKVGQALVFDGSNDLVELGNPPLLQLQDLTIETWLRRADASTASYGSGGNGVIFGYGQGGYGLYMTSAGTLFFTKMGISATQMPAPGITDTNFHHVAVTKSGSTMTFYLDGIPYQAAPLSTTFTFTTPAAIGARGDNRDNSFYGVIDELAIYAGALTEQEIGRIVKAGTSGKCLAVPPSIVQPLAAQTKYVTEIATFAVLASGSGKLSYTWRHGETVLAGQTNAVLVLDNLSAGHAGVYSVTVTSAFGSAVSQGLLVLMPLPPCAAIPSGLVSWWKAEGDALDQVNGLNGTLVGNCAFQSGRVGQAFAFDGEFDGILLGRPQQLQVQNLSIECWVKRDSATMISKQNGPGFIISHGVGGYGLFIDSGGRMGFGRVGTSPIVGPPSVQDTNWHHIAVTRNGSSMSFYQDGLLKGTAYTSISFYFTNDVTIGARDVSLTNTFLGAIDELSIYNTVLTGNQLQAIYAAKMVGKCPATFPVRIVTQPADQDVFVGANATFSVAVAGTPPFAFQWKRDGNPVNGATNSFLTFTNVQMNQRGKYSAFVTNLYGADVSSNALLRVSLPPALVQVLDTAGGSAGSLVTVPVVMVANGNENALGFSLNFDPQKLTFVEALPGSGISNGDIIKNTSGIAEGKLGLIIGLAAGTLFPAGTQEVARIVFNTSPSTTAATTVLSFGDAPTPREVSDAAAAALNAAYVSGTLYMAPSQFEADSTPRPTGDASVSVTDWVQAGRYVARLDYPTNASEFQRADCAPRSTKGDGLITVNDWVQAGRYAAGIDQWELAGGPSAEQQPAPSPVKGSGKDPILRGPEPRYLRITDGILLDNQSGQVSVQLSSQGDESALSFSVSFDPVALVFVSAEKGSGVGTATFNPNTLDAANGKLGFAIAMLNKNFAPGLTELVKLTFRAGSSASVEAVVSLADQPVPRGISDTNALGLLSEYFAGTISINPAPVLTISLTNQVVNLTWPQWATNYALHEASDLSGGSALWTKVPADPVLSGQERRLMLPVGGISRFYRLQKN